MLYSLLYVYEGYHGKPAKLDELYISGVSV